MCQLEIQYNGQWGSTGLGATTSDASRGSYACQLDDETICVQTCTNTINSYSSRDGNPFGMPSSTTGLKNAPARIKIWTID